MFQRIGTMPPEERFTRTVFAFIMIASTFVAWGKWVTFTLGVLFLISVAQGVCLTCHFYKKLLAKK